MIRSLFANLNTLFGIASLVFFKAHLLYLFKTLSILMLQRTHLICLQLNFIVE